MIERQCRLEQIELVDLLTVDSYGSIIYIYDDGDTYPHKLIKDREEFFNGLFSDVEEKSIKILQDDRNVNLDELLGELDRAQQSCIVLIEGFAGCGKSTFVQYILSRQLKGYNFEDSLYNYDIEAQNDIIVRNEDGKVVRNSSIFAAIKRCFYDQFITTAKRKSKVIDDFTTLLEKCKDFTPFKDLYYNIVVTDSYKKCKQYIKKGDYERKEYIIVELIKRQVDTIQSSGCILGLDCLFRLAMYKNGLYKKLYVCYDNLDAIEDAEDLKGFDDKLIEFRKHIDSYIRIIAKTGFFGKLQMPHFITLATYRKITASMALETAGLYKEVREDDRSGYRSQDGVYNIDATSVFSYKRIVEQRLKYFRNYFEKALNISSDTSNRILINFNSWYNLNQKLEIMQDRYSCLWNKNYRTCSVIANELYTRSNYHFQDNVKLINYGRVMDGYNIDEDDDGNNVLCSYYGGSAIMLSSVCQVFNTNHIWDDFLDLAKLNTGEKSYKHVSLSRMILTYMYNKKSSVSFEELISTFCKDGLFSPKKLCDILSKMLARYPKGVWRRPIYYSNGFIPSESAVDIAKTLLDEYQLMSKSDAPLHNYRFLLCDSGKAYVERLMQEFEFFSNRISNNNKALYIYTNREQMKDVIDKVYNAVKQCCENMLEFRKKYMDIYKLSDDKYLEMLFHPRTNKTLSPQMHTERTIFSHIAYLNKVRRYFINKDVVKNLEERKEFNKLFVKYINNYLELYDAYSYIYSAKRRSIAEKLMKKTKLINNEIEKGSDNYNILFMSISS